MKMTQNDPILAVALTKPLRYRQVDDQNFLDVQNSYDHRAGGRFGDEPTAVRHCWRYGPYRQSSAFRRLWRFSGTGAFGLAQTLGRLVVSFARNIRNRDRTFATQHGIGANGLSCRYSRKSRWGRNCFGFLPYFLDTTSTIERRYSCAA